MTKDKNVIAPAYKRAYDALWWAVYGEETNLTIHQSAWLKAASIASAYGMTYNKVLHLLGSPPMGNGRFLPLVTPKSRKTVHHWWHLMGTLTLVSRKMGMRNIQKLHESEGLLTHSEELLLQELEDRYGYPIS